MVIVAIDKLTNIVKYTSIPSILPENISELDNDELFFKISELEVSILLNSYYKNNEFKQLPEKPSNYHIWNLETEQWQEPENYQQLLFNEAASKVKQERQRLLTATDWTDTVSASTRLENYNAWQFYRQQLRDITTQEGYPFNVIWPTQPV
jgi:hypothetical protein